MGCIAIAIAYPPLSALCLPIVTIKPFSLRLRTEEMNPMRKR